jgi:ketosteroid isomerase-like protein
MNTFIIGKCFVICGTAKNQGNTMAKKQAFKNSNAAYAKAFNAGEPAKVAALYSKDAIFMMPETPTYKGTKGVLAQTQVAIDGDWRDIKFRTIKSGSDGDLAFNIGTVAMSSAVRRWRGQREGQVPRRLPPSKGWRLEDNRWGLSADYPIVAANYAKRRSKLAKAIGLGSRPRRRRS